MPTPPPDANASPADPSEVAPIAPAASMAATGQIARLQALRINARLLWVLVLAVIIYTAFLASSLILPMVVAAFFALLLSPLIRRAPLRWLPRGIAAFLLVSGLLVSLGAVGYFVAEPAAEWARKVPFVIRDAAPRLQAMIQPLHEARRAGASLGEIAGGDDPSTERIVVSPPPADLLAATPRVLGSMLAVLLLTFTFLVYGDDVLRKLMALRHTRAQKRLTAEIVQRIQSDLSRYMLTVAATAAILGAATALLLWYLGVEDPLLWGVLAAALNFTPIVGPLLMAAMLTLVGLSQFDTMGAALMPAIGYVVLNGFEAQLLTPMVLGRTMKINPLAIILWLMLWGWLWGMVGLLVAVPMLVCLKIVASRFEATQVWSRILD